MFYDVQVLLVKEKDGDLSEIWHRGETYSFKSERELKNGIKQIEKDNPEWKRIDLTTFIPKHRWSYIELRVKKNGYVDSSIFYWVN